MLKKVVTKKSAENSADIIRFLLNDLDRMEEEKTKDKKDISVKEGMMLALQDAYIALKMVDEDGISFEFPDDIAEGDVFKKGENNENEESDEEQTEERSEESGEKEA